MTSKTSVEFLCGISSIREIDDRSHLNVHEARHTSSIVTRAYIQGQMHAVHLLSFRVVRPLPLVTPLCASPAPTMCENHSFGLDCRSAIHRRLSILAQVHLGALRRVPPGAPNHLHPTQTAALKNLHDVPFRRRVRTRSFSYKYVGRTKQLRHS